MGKAAIKEIKGLQVIHPAGIIKRAGGESALPENWTARLIQGWEMKELVAQIEKEFERINADIVATFAPGEVLIVPGVCRVSVASRSTTKVTDAERLAAVVGEGRFGDLVAQIVSYKPEQKLIDMAADADEPLGASLRECLSIKVTTTATWRAEGQAAA